MASDCAQAALRVHVHTQVRSLVYAARHAVQLPGGTWRDQRTHAVTELSHLMQLAGDELVLAVLFDGFADMVFMEADRLAYSTTQNVTQRHYSDTLARTWHAARLRRLANT